MIQRINESINEATTMIETQRQVAPMPKSGGQMTGKEKRGRKKEKKEMKGRKHTHSCHLTMKSDKLSMCESESEGESAVGCE